ncbi:hypothetical protein SOVF_173360 [Spinacia oleracea]|uniref:DUF1308 domain-containing protein n=1 Tax=Spinacia oleracea TaxID=3562 RepID=A0A9R0JGD4_SPIOL|nr:uncharacterized protein LOC110806035 [Spinacia oleracea]KNA07281.1 hypothetical protein SOVF_173360 [Spinacia oleracea]
MEEREWATRRCEEALDRIQGLPLSNITASCKATLLRLVNSELNFLSRLSLSTSKSSSPFSCNVGYFEAIVHILQQPYIVGVSRVCKPIPLSPTTSHGGKTDSPCEAVHIDIVCSLHNSPTWFIVSDRNPKYITWDSSGRDKGLKTRIEQIVRAAQFSLALKPVSIVLFFANGLDAAICERLMTNFGFREFDLEFSHFEFVFSDALEGEWVNVLGKSYQRACSLIMDVDPCAKPCQRIEYVEEVSSSGVQLAETNYELGLGSSFCCLIEMMKEWPLDVKSLESCKREDLSGENDVVNFDTTALVAIISGISNGGSEKLLAKSENELRQRFKSNTEFVIFQAQSEIENAIHDELKLLLCGKKGIACKTVHSEFTELFSMFGGPYEQMRANQLIKRLKIVPDTPSPRMMSLPVTRKLALKNKVAFGTGDYLGAPTLTANMGFVRAVSQTGMSLFSLEHRPRALVGD